MFIKRYKHPRTYHLPWSPGVSSDDKVLSSVNQFKNKNIIITEKRDGECTTLYPDGYVHARSIDSTSHPGQYWIKNFWNAKCYNLPKGWRFVGENLYCKHSIQYTDLNSFFEVFALVNAENEVCSWEETKLYCDLLEMKMVPVLYSGVWNEKEIAKFHTVLDLEQQEGFVVRIEDSFHYSAYSQYVGKWVRKGHVQTDKHWKYTQLIKNELKDQ